jgi:restriction system protein
LAAIADQTGTPEEVMRVACRQIEQSLAQEILDRILAAPPDFFERLIVNLLLAMGFGGSAADAGRAPGRRYHRTAHRITSAVNCRPLKD